jgi:hypothetical protein
MQREFPPTPMGVLAPGSAHMRPLAQTPIDMSKKFPVHVSAESPSNISPNPSEVISIGQLLKLKKKKKNAPEGARGGLQILLGVNISFFCENKSFGALTDLLLIFSPKNTQKNLKIAPEFYFFLRIFIIFFRVPCKNLKPYNNPFCGFESQW